MTHTKQLGKGLKNLGVLLFLLILSPISLTMSFKALDKFSETPNYWVAILLILISSFLTIFTLGFAFRTFKTLLDAFFKHQ